MPSARITNTTPFTTYTMTVQPKNAIGLGPKSPPVTAQFNYNKASGGTEKDYVAGGKLWKQHVYQSPGTFTFTVESSVKEWKIRLIGRGGNAGGADPPMDPATNGGAAGFHEITVDSLPLKGLTVKVGNAYSQTPCCYDMSPANSSFEGVGHAGAGGNGFRTQYCYHGSQGATGSWGGKSNGINGGSHPGKCNGWAVGGYGSSGLNSSGFWKLWDGTSGTWGNYNGGLALVAITYEIGTATRAQIVADEERRRAYDASDEAARVRQEIADSEAHAKAVAFETPELDAAIDEAFDD